LKLITAQFSTTEAQLNETISATIFVLGRGRGPERQTHYTFEYGSTNVDFCTPHCVPAYKRSWTMAGI